MSNDTFFSPEAEAMHAGAAEHSERAAVLAEMNAEGDAVRIPAGHQFPANFNFDFLKED